MTHEEVAIQQLASQAAKGAPWAVKRVADFSERLGRLPPPPPEPSMLTEEQALKMTLYVQQLMDLEEWLVAGKLIYKFEGRLLLLSPDLWELIQKNSGTLGLTAADFPGGHPPLVANKYELADGPIGFDQTIRHYVSDLDSAPLIGGPVDEENSKEAI